MLRSERNHTGDIVTDLNSCRGSCVLSSGSRNLRQHAVTAVFAMFFAFLSVFSSLTAATDSLPPDSGSVAAGTGAVSTDESGQPGSRGEAADSVIQRLSKQRSGDSTAAGFPLDLSEREHDGVFSAKNISMVLIVIGLLVLFLHFLRRFMFRPLGGGSPDEQFKVLRQFHLGPKKSVTLVRFFGRLLLLGVTDANINTLAEIDDPEEVERIINQAGKAEQEQSAGFKDIYQNLISRTKKNSQS